MLWHSTCGAPFGGALVVIIPSGCSPRTMIRLSTDSVIDVTITFVLAAGPFERKERP